MKVLIGILVGLLALPAAAEIEMATLVQGIPGLAFADCRARVKAALAADGYPSTYDFGNGWIGTNATNSASVACIKTSTETVVDIVVAGPRATERRNSLLNLVREGPRAKSGRLGAQVLAGRMVRVTWDGTPGRTNDWISIRPITEPDNSFGSTWIYTSGPSGSQEFGPLAPGRYEVRLYFDWPTGQYVVQERLAVNVE